LSFQDLSFCGTPVGMDWGTVIGAFIGAAIPSSGTLLTLRAERRKQLRERQWMDAEVVADVDSLLHDIDPMRRAMNLNPAEGAEDALWAGLETRRDDLQRRLLRLGSGHPSQEVREPARRLASEVFNAAVSSRWVVHDMLLGRDSKEQMETAQRDHDHAVGDATDLRRAVESAGSGRRFERQRRAIQRWRQAREQKRRSLAE